VIGLKKAQLVLPLVLLAIVSCSQVKEQIEIDIPLEGQTEILSEYRNRLAWTRVIVEDLGEGGSIPVDTKVIIIDVDMHKKGAVTVDTADKRKLRVVSGLNIEPPLAPEKIRDRMSDIFWFEDPTLRQIGYIRKWGKKIAAAVIEHEVFIGMPGEAAEESWGMPAKKNVSEIAGKTEEQWVYPAGKRNKYIYIIEGKVSKWED